MLQSRQLEVFRAVMLTGGMTSAADMVGITQPAISRLVRDLEEEVGFRLFERIGNRLRPTPEAVILFKEVSLHFHGIDRIGKVADDLRKSQLGSVRVACYTALAMSFMSEVIQTFVADRPDVSIYLHDDSSRTVLELVALHHFDIGISFTTADYPGVVMEPLPTFCAECIVPTTHRLSEKDFITPIDLEGETLVSLGVNSLLRMQLDAVLVESNVSCVRHIESTLALSVCDLVSKGLGIGLVDPFTASFYGDRDLCRKPFVPGVPYHFAIALPSGKAPPRLVDQFCATLRAAVDRLPFERM
ncbi:LysR family transcriptional regulator [Rhizobium rhizogenes]|uniref:LysR family transcriptional regulator n=1 Tax=Rhizobium rhizogenes TaxID=359 RepID=UPI001572A51F|nr:LysR family transcriptional regulator [Rhizobium rhizogenes]NTH68561.1 LysR family transcriptional regulator [Rhizobium rhizogenes]NTI39700.1 LysR family transcriptional regulator [Rhizobium rhizogenes]WEO69921.1 LysR family transcriptional regulator [Rhizobium rhizogenes]